MILCHIIWNAKSDYSSLWLLLWLLQWLQNTTVLLRFRLLAYNWTLFIHFSWSLQVQRLYISPLNAFFFSFGIVIAAFHSNLRAFKIPCCKTAVPWLAAKCHTAAHSPSTAPAGCGIEQEEQKNSRVKFQQQRKEEEGRRSKTNQEMRKNHWPPPTSSPVPSQSLSSGYPPQSPSPSFHCQAQHTTHYVSQSEFGSAVLVVLPLHFLCTPPVKRV